MDGDWSQPRREPAVASGELAAALAAVATLPVVALLLERFADAPRGVLAATASLPLAALLLVALTWRPARGGLP